MNISSIPLSHFLLWIMFLVFCILLDFSSFDIYCVHYSFGVLNKKKIPSLPAPQILKNYATAALWLLCCVTRVTTILLLLSYGIFVARRGVVCSTRQIMRTRVCLRLTARVKAGPVKVIDIYRERAAARNFCAHLNNFSDRDIVSKLAYRTCIYNADTRPLRCTYYVAM